MTYFSLDHHKTASKALLQAEKLYKQGKQLGDQKLLDKEKRKKAAAIPDYEKAIAHYRLAKEVFEKGLATEDAKKLPTENRAYASFYNAWSQSFTLLRLKELRQDVLTMDITGEQLEKWGAEIDDLLKFAAKEIDVLEKLNLGKKKIHNETGKPLSIDTLIKKAKEDLEEARRIWKGEFNTPDLLKKRIEYLENQIEFIKFKNKKNEEQQKVILQLQESLADRYFDIGMGKENEEKQHSLKMAIKTLNTLFDWYAEFEIKIPISLHLSFLLFCSTRYELTKNSQDLSSVINHIKNYELDSENVLNNIKDQEHRNELISYPQYIKDQLALLKEGPDQKPLSDEGECELIFEALPTHKPSLQNKDSKESQKNAFWDNLFPSVEIFPDEKKTSNPSFLSSDSSSPLRNFSVMSSKGKRIREKSHNAISENNERQFKKLKPGAG
jgi:hypothetical protein